MAWTGEELLVWSGYVFTGSGGGEPLEADGFVFDARAQTWARMAASPLAPRVDPASAWTGEEFLIWGGTDGREERFFGDGAAYDPRTERWRLLPQAPIERRAALSVWTGEELIVWGTTVRVSRPRDGAAYNPRTDSWRRIAESPIELTDATAVWTGREMIVFGAALHGGNFPETPTAIGAAYEPETDTWRELPTSKLSPQASTAAWNGREVIAWDYLNAAAAYDPHTDDWRRLPAVPLWSGECAPESVSIAAYVFGDYCGLLALYDPAVDRWHDISHREFLGFGFELVAAPPVVLLLGRNADTNEERMLAYRPPR